MAEFAIRDQKQLIDSLQSGNKFGGYDEAINESENCIKDFRRIYRKLNKAKNDNNPYY